MNQKLANEFSYGRCGSMGRGWDRSYPNCSIHHTAIIGENAEWIGKDSCGTVLVGADTIIRPFVTVDRGTSGDTVIGNDCLLMAHVHVGHDVVIGRRVQIAPHASIGGCVIIGDDVKIGMGATIKPGVTVGDGARIGMGAVILRDIPANEVWVGNPARKVTKSISPL